MISCLSFTQGLGSGYPPRAPMPRTGAVKDTQCQMQTQSDRGNSENGRAVRPVLWNPVYLAHQRAARPYYMKITHSFFPCSQGSYMQQPHRYAVRGQSTMDKQNLVPRHDANSDPPRNHQRPRGRSGTNVLVGSSMVLCWARFMSVHLTSSALERCAGK